MQDNTITISGIAYDRFQELPDRSVYTHPDHTIGLNHILSLSRVVPTSEGAAARVRTKFVRDVVRDTPAGKEKGSIYTTIEVSRPVWASDADVQAESASAATFMQSPEYGTLLSKQSI